MTIKDILELVDENTFVSITDSETGAVIATYNGKDSIPKGLNPCKVVKIRADYSLEIQI